MNSEKMTTLTAFVSQFDKRDNVADAWLKAAAEVLDDCGAASLKETARRFTAGEIDRKNIGGMPSVPEFSREAHKIEQAKRLAGKLNKRNGELQEAAGEAKDRFGQILRNGQTYAMALDFAANMIKAGSSTVYDRAEKLHEGFADIDLHTIRRDLREMLPPLPPPMADEQMNACAREINTSLHGPLRKAAMRLWEIMESKRQARKAQGNLPVPANVIDEGKYL